MRGAAKAAATASECLRRGETRRDDNRKAIRKEQQAGRLRADSYSTAVARAVIATVSGNSSG